MTLSVSLSFFLSVSLNVGTWERMTLSRARARQGKDDSLSLSKRGSRGEDDSLSRARALSIKMEPWEKITSFWFKANHIRSPPEQLRM